MFPSLTKEQRKELDRRAEALMTYMTEFKVPSIDGYGKVGAEAGAHMKVTVEYLQ